jgi:hypothetical protein
MGSRWAKVLVSVRGFVYIDRQLSTDRIATRSSIWEPSKSDQVIVRRERFQLSFGVVDGASTF